MAIRNVFEHVQQLTAEFESVDVAGLKDELAGGFTHWQQAGEQVEDVAATSRWMRREKE